MKTALVTTTINVPHVLKLYRALDQDVQFFVIGDEKSPPDAEDFCATLGNAEYYSPRMQRNLNYKCSELIGWNCIQRRNIGFLEALKWGAEIIISIDDDNIPLDYYFDSFETAFAYPHNGIAVSGCATWFDPGSLLVPNAKHRGFPHSARQPWRVDPITDARIGVVAGLCLGDPDIDATTRMEHAPIVHGVSELARSGVVVNHGTTTVFNSQNTAFLRELAPALFMFPGVGRYDDIYASLVCQRIMRDHGLHVRFGQPFVWQERNEHDLVSDLRAEIDGLGGVPKLARALTQLTLQEGAGVINHMRYICNDIYVRKTLPIQAVEAANAWLDDIEKVL